MCTLNTFGTQWKIFLRFVIQPSNFQALISKSLLAASRLLESERIGIYIIISPLTTRLHEDMSKLSREGTS